MILLSIDHLGRKSDHLPSLEDDEDYLDINIDGSGSGDGESFDHGSGISSDKWETRYAYVLIENERRLKDFDHYEAIILSSPF